MKGSKERMLKFGAASLAVAGMLAVTSLAPRAQQPQQGQPPAQGQAAQQAQGQPPATAPSAPAAANGTAPADGAAIANVAAPPAAPVKPLIPVAASSLVKNPGPYWGERVSLYGAVEQTISPTVFSVDQDPTKSTGQEVLILTPKMYGNVDPNAYVTVFGEVVKLDSPDLSQKLKAAKIEGTITPEMTEKFRGSPVILASGVVTSAMIDLTKRLPPPMSTEEDAFDKVMKKVGPAFAALRQAADKSDVDKTKEQTTFLKQAFTDTESFWKTKNKSNAVQWAQDARKTVDAIDHSLTAGKWDDVKTSAGTLGQACQTCHGTYRERFDDGSFRVKLDK
jgi:cytochrome c556